jgi:hypothetical protein
MTSPESENPMVALGQVNPAHWNRVEVITMRPGQPDMRQSTEGGDAVTAAWLRAVADQLDPPRPNYRGGAVRGTADENPRGGAPLRTRGASVSVPPSTEGVRVLDEHPPGSANALAAQARRSRPSRPGRTDPMSFR